MKKHRRMAVLVCGDRHYKDRVKIGGMVRRYSDRISLLIQGGARGADSIAWEYAVLLGIPTATFEANWSKYGLGAGPIRNRAMLQVLVALRKDKWRTEVWAFHKNFKKSKGTLGMVTLAREENITVKLFQK